MSKLPLSTKSLGCLLALGVLCVVSFASMAAADITNGLVAYYPFDANADDVSGNGNHGTVLGAVLTTDRFGRQQHAYAFDGTNDYIRVAYSSSYRPATQLTVSAWVSLTNKTGSRTPLSCTENGGWNLNLGYGGDPNMKFGIYVGSTSVTPGFGPDLLPDRTWHHVVGTYDGTSAKIYLDGLLRSSAPVTGTIHYVNNNAMVIGGEAGVSTTPATIGFFAGSIDDVRVYGRALSAAEVETLFATTPLDLTTGLVAHYRLDGNGLDSSGNGYHGTVIGAVLADGVRGETGGACGFDGNDYVGIQPVPLLQQLTMSAWFKVPAEGTIAPDNSMTLVGADGSYKVYLYGTNSLTLHGNSKAGSVPSGAWTGGPSYTNPVSRGVWHHVAWSRALNGHQELFLDGQLVGQGNYNAGTIPEGYGEYIGLDRMHNGTLRYFFYGSMDDVRIYNRPLTAAEVSGLSSALPPTLPPPDEPTNAPCLHYTFDGEDGTNVVDVSGATHDGTAVNAALQDGPVGCEGNVRVFNGSNSYIRVHDESPFDFRAAPFSVSMWVRPSPNGSGLAKALISKYFTFYQRQWAIFVEADGRLNIDTSATGQYGQDRIRRTTVAAVRPGVWQHVVVTRNGTDAQFFVDGEVVPNDGAPIHGTFLDTAEPVRIGTYRVENGAVTGHPHVYEGLMDEVRIYPRALSPDAVRDIYTNSVYADLVQLQITGQPVEAGAPTPLGYGTHMAAGGALVTNSVDALVSGPVGTRYLSAGWTGSGSVPATGSTQTAVFELNTNSVLTWQWHAQHWLDVSAYAGGTVDATNAWFNAGAMLTLTATPDASSQFVRWVGTLPGGASTNNPLALTMDRPHTVAAVFRERDTVFANHWDDDGYYFPGDNIVQCRFYIEQPEDLLSLAWRPGLPAGWSLVSAQGDGDPQIYGGEIVFSQHNLKNPITFTYTVSVPPATSGARQITGEALYMLDGMANPATVRATPNPLVLNLYPYAYHTADYQDPRWLIDATEVSRVLAYWRAGWYKPNLAGFDGYAPTTKPYDGGTNTRHRADYKTPYWKINAPEANRVLAYWRAGGYRVDPEGDDGFAPLVYTAAGERRALALSADGAPLAATPLTSGGLTYDPGATLTLTNTVTFDSGLLALCVRPQLPAGWTLASVNAPGNPELVAGEILWTGTLPSSPLTLVLTVHVPVSSIGDKTLGGAVDAFVGSGSNPTNVPIALSTLAMQPTDSDADGLPDAWERVYADGTTDLDPGEDDDADGADNREEWLAGTHPRNAGSVFAIGELGASREGEIGVAWQSAGERVYGVAAAAQASGPYSNVVSGIAATPPTNAVAPLALPPGASFIRIVLEQPQP